jgi:hypothetical protein
MKYVIVAGYVATGSSVVNDLLKEVDGYLDFEDEFKLFREDSGILDLERSLIRDWNWLKSGKAVERFYSLCEKFVSHACPPYKYEVTFDKDFMKHIQQFIDEITETKILYGSSMFVLDKRTKYKFEYRNRLLSYQVSYPEYKELNFVDITQQEFCQAVQRMIDNMFSSYSDEKQGGYSSIILDQGLPPAAADRVSDFFPQGKCFVINRDPRDTALSMIQRRKAMGTELVRNLDADLYSRWYKKVHLDWQTSTNPNVAYFRYEDLILDYENCKNRIFDMLDISPEMHTQQYKYFDPKVSATRIGKWKNFKEDFCSKEEWYAFCEKVHEALPEYCYDI